MIFQTIEFLQILADIIGSILLFLKPIITPIGDWMVGWITAGMDFLRNNFSTDYTFYIIICAVLIVSGIIVNIIWPGDKPGSSFQKGAEKIEDFDDKMDESESEDILDDIKRCKDCGNPVGDSEVCPLCGARQI
ncbi:MAG: hypothetical protein ACXABO_02540 [Promethearchaeota archaeon]|jgi:hypothetical protein